MQKMQNLEDKKVAIVADWIKDWWWAEVVLTHLLEIFPNADIFTSIFFQENNPVFKWRKITTSFIQEIPFLNKSHKLALLLRPLAFESFDLSAYDIVISSTSAESKWVITKPETIQICYCHTPTRYFWSHYHEYLGMMEFWALNLLWKYLMPKLVHSLRKWDFVASKRPDFYIANSQNTANRIKKYYWRESEVIYPWIDIDKFELKENHSKNYWWKDDGDNFYLYVGRCIPYKKFDLIVEAFNKNWKKVVLVTNTDNKLYRELKAISKENIEWKLNISRDETRQLFRDARWFLFPVEEDFGIVPLEAQACWTPVIALSIWWALETVVEWITWTFFGSQTANSLNKAIERFETMSFNWKKIREHARNFDTKIFKEKMLEFVEEKIK